MPFPSLKPCVLCKGMSPRSQLHTAPLPFAPLCEATRSPPLDASQRKRTLESALSQILITSFQILILQAATGALCVTISTRRFASAVSVSL